ncbi:acyl-CoA thioesterase [Candidatus Cloacimonadota bacterium]
MFEHKRKIYGYMCDIYGHLNNSSYLQIYEEARSEALIEMGFPISKLIELDIQIYLTRVELVYKKGIANDEVITVKTAIAKMNRLKAVWKQDIFDSQGELCNTAIVDGVFIKNGKPARIDKEIYQIFENFYEAKIIIE